jgi:hypothetical protein
VMADFTPSEEEPEESATNSEPVADLNAASSDPEPDITEGGAHMNEDPKPGEKKQVMYPLAIILSDRRYQALQKWKQEQGISSDQTAFLKGHEVFRAT